MIAVCVLDVVELHRGADTIPVRSGKTAEVLVRLALEAGMLVRTERLIEDLWAAEAVATARNTLQTKVSRLRRALGDPALVTGSRAGYTLAVDASAVDALEVLGLGEQATAFRDAGDAWAALETCAIALAMFKGDILSGAGDAEWVLPHRVRLEEVRLRLVEDQLAARLDLGAAGDLVGELEALVRLQPLREGLWELLMVALYRDGRQAEALAAFQRARVTLADDLGLEPGLQLQQLEHQILTHDPSLGGPASTTRPLGPQKPPGNLPALSAELVGRAAEAAAVVDLLAERPLVELVGPGGVGKTALAIATGRALNGTSTPGGVWLARLEAATNDHEVVDTLVAAVGVGGEAALYERLKTSAALVILDNCEHVVDGASALALRLLDHAPDVRVLCTSQTPLGIDGEAVFELAPLALADAVALFTQRAGSQRSNRMAVGSAEGAVEELCQSLDRLPLAIELAAARTKTLAIGEISRRLDDRFSVLSDPTSRRPERRRALRSTIGWSYDLLFPDDQRGLWALATFAGGAPLPAVEHVLEALDVPVATGIDVVSRLGSRSLVVVEDIEGSSTKVRYRLLESIRAFALEAMATAGLAERAFAAHAAWFARRATASTDGVRGADQAEHLAFARTERPNIDAALTWSTEHDPQLALTIATGFGWAWVVLGDSRGAQRLLAALDAAGEATPASARAEALLLAAWIEASTDRLELARGHIDEASVLAEAIEDVDLRARCSYYLAYVVSHHGNFRQALELTDRSDALYADLGRHWDQAASWLFAARAAISAGDEARSVDAVARVEQLLLDVDDPWLHVRHEAVRGELARLQHRFTDAVDHTGRAAETSRHLGFQQTEAYQLSSLGRAQCQAGDYEAGATTLEVAVAKAQATGDVRLAALARVHLGRVLRALGHDADARLALEHAVSWHRASGGGEQAALGDCLLAAMQAGDPRSDAQPALELETVLIDAQRSELAHVEVFALDALARIAADAGDLVRARELCGAADRRMADAAHFITEYDRVDARRVRQLI